MRAWLVGTVVATVVAGALSPAMAGDDSLETKVQRLESLVEAQADRIRTLESTRSETWLNERRAEEVKTLVREVLADADSRAALMDSAITAGHNGQNFFLSSGDGNFLMNISGQLQVRYVANFRDSEDGSSNDDGEAGFTIPRAKVQFDGHVFSPRLHYALRFNVDEEFQEVFTDRIVIGYDLTDSLYVWVGEDTAPFLREELIDSSRQLAVERSLVNEIFSVDKVQGVGVKWDAHEMVKVGAMFHDGIRSGQSSVDDGFNAEHGSPFFHSGEFSGDAGGFGKDFDDDDTDFALTGRADVLLAGSWDQWRDFTSWSGEEMFATVGGAIHYERSETGDTSANIEYLSWTVDGSVEYRGASVYAAYVGAQIDDRGDSIAGLDDYTPWGVVVQGAYNFDLNNDTQLEPFVRWEYLDLDDLSSITGNTDQDDEISLITVGGNWYHFKHNAKLTADVVFALDPLHGNVPVVNNNGNGTSLLQDDDDQDGQVVLRLQYQLLF